MACQPANVKFQLRRATSSNWSSSNPILSAGEPGVEIDTNRLKIGDGVTRWNLLQYVAGSGSGGIGLQGPQGPTGANSTVPGPTGPQGPTGANSTVPGPTGPQGPTGPVSSYIFDGGDATSTYVYGPAFDCGTAN